MTCKLLWCWLLLWKVSTPSPMLHCRQFTARQNWQHQCANQVSDLLVSSLQQPTCKQKNKFPSKIQHLSAKPVISSMQFKFAYKVETCYIYLLSLFSVKTCWLFLIKQNVTLPPTPSWPKQRNNQSIKIPQLWSCCLPTLNSNWKKM